MALALEEFMIWIDYVIIAVVGFSALVSLVRGFVREALSLVTWDARFLSPVITMPTLLSGLQVLTTNWFGTESPLRCCSLRPLIVGAIVNYVIGSLVEKPACREPIGY